MIRYVPLSLKTPFELLSKPMSAAPVMPLRSQENPSRRALMLCAIKRITKQSVFFQLGPKQDAVAATFH